MHPSRNRLGRRPGFTLVEVVVAIVILGVLGVALTRLLVSQSRYYNHETNARAARTIARSSMNILVSDLRMMQDQGGVDLASADGKTLRVLVPYRFGIVCSTNNASTTVSMLPIDSATNALATYGGFAWRGPTGTYTYITPSSPLGVEAPVSSASPTMCTGSGAGQAQLRTVSLNGRTGDILDLLADAPSGATQAAPVFLWQKITYTFAASSMYSGKIGLWRNVSGRANEEIMAPFDTSARFKYYAVGDTVSHTTVPALLTDIRGVDIVLNAVSPKVTSNDPTPSQAKIITSVFFKNVKAF
ncbi:MAG TPA: prepilin-type N-terminal cleavage/methylation domain-containing protein [Gemmatimonadaceae bacterium]|nr:prepilin-type N-terminal cleavage/methylation domain-containing protein [Gemmatimonadaceae bacterium]